LARTRSSQQKVIRFNPEHTIESQVISLRTPPIPNPFLNAGRRRINHLSTTSQEWPSRVGQTQINKCCTVNKSRHSTCSDNSDKHRTLHTTQWKMDKSTQNRAPPSIIPTRYQVTENPALPIFIPHPLPSLLHQLFPCPTPRTPYAPRVHSCSPLNYLKICHAS